jgi:hypothetical protein
VPKNSSQLDDFEAHALGADTGGPSRLVLLQQMAQHSDSEAELARNLYEALANPQGLDGDPEEPAPAWGAFARFVVRAAREISSAEADEHPDLEDADDREEDEPS